ncbi:MAG: DUF2589 domain-containing protein [Prevotella sp.]|nr:DUF2589 domain-containing protein [Prevotella sp.]
MKENDNSAKKSVTRTSSQVMDLQQLIAGPLIATVEADAMSAQRYYSYLMKIAFEDYNPATNSASRLRLLTFNYFDNDANGRREQTVSIPLFTIIPLPLLQIQEADFDFDIKIVDSITEAVEDRFSYENGTIEEGHEERASLKMRASLAPQGGQKKGDTQQNFSANMKVHVKMRQADMPAGLSNLLHLAANNMSVQDTTNEKTVETTDDKQNSSNEQS